MGGDNAVSPDNKQHQPGGKSIQGLAALQAEVFQKAGKTVPDSELAQKQSYLTIEIGHKMAARSRPRNGAIKEDPADAHEELSMWDGIEKDIKKCSVIQKRCKEVSSKIVEMEEKMGKCKSFIFWASLAQSLDHICCKFSTRDCKTDHVAHI